MKILFCDFNIPDLIKDDGKTTGGAAVRINALASGMVILGHDVGVLTWKGANQFIGKDVPYRLIETYPPKGGIRFIRKIYYNFFHMLVATRKYNPDIVFTMGNSIDAGIIAVISKLLNIPLGYLVTNNKDVDNRVKADQSTITHILFKFALNRAELFVGQNIYQISCLKERYPDKAFCLLYNPISISHNNFPVKPKKKRSYVAWIGVFSYQKNFPALLDICKALPSIHFKVAGSMPNNAVISNNSRKLDELSQSALNALAGLSNVELIGYVKRTDILKFLSEAYLLLNTSHYEGFSNTFLESFMAGTPVVTRREIDPDNIISDHYLGRSVSNYSELPDAIYEVINSENFIYLAERCRVYVLENHDLIKISAKLAQKIETILSNQ